MRIDPTSAHILFLAKPQLLGVTDQFYETFFKRSNSDPRLRLANEALKRSCEGLRFVLYDDLKGFWPLTSSDKENVYVIGKFEIKPPLHPDERIEYEDRFKGDLYKLFGNFYPERYLCPINLRVDLDEVSFDIKNCSKH